jgi:hypothetical protein
VNSVFTAENAEGAEKRENQISGIILDAAIAVHTALGPGLPDGLSGMFSIRINEPRLEGSDSSSAANKVPRRLR